MLSCNIRPAQLTLQSTVVIFLKTFSVYIPLFFPFLQASNGQWHEMNDSTVTMVSPQHVLKQQAYILFYSKVQPIVPVNDPKDSKTASAVVNGVVGGVNGVVSTKSSNSKVDSSSGSYIDDLGESLTVEELELAHSREITQKTKLTEMAEKAHVVTSNSSHSSSSSASSSEDEKSILNQGEGSDEEELEECRMNGIDGKKEGKRGGKEGENEDECTNMLYDNCTTRLKKKYSWAVKPFR